MMLSISTGAEIQFINAHLLPREKRHLHGMTNVWDEYIFFHFCKTSEMTTLSHFQEEELRKSGEAKYAHLSNDLHVLIEVFAPPGEAYSRMSHALEEIKKFLVPVSSFRLFHLLKLL